MNSDFATSNGALVLLPFLIMIFFSLIITAIGFVILYFVVRAALNNSKLNQNMEQLRFEIARMNEQLLRNSSYTSENSEDRRE
jgi:uncharacterized membrane-anchored protein YhcB (DUF1043 family)